MFFFFLQRLTFCLKWRKLCLLRRGYVNWRHFSMERKEDQHHCFRLGPYSSLVIQCLFAMKVPVDLYIRSYGYCIIWTVLVFFLLSTAAEVSSGLYEAYKQELDLKRTILREVAHTANPDLCMVYLSCWLYQPYIQDNTKLLLESLLMETGHRAV